MALHREKCKSGFWIHYERQCLLPIDVSFKLAYYTNASFSAGMCSSWYLAVEALTAVPDREGRSLDHFIRAS